MLYKKGNNIYRVKFKVIKGGSLEEFKPYLVAYLVRLTKSSLPRFKKFIIEVKNAKNKEERKKILKKHWNEFATFENLVYDPVANGVIDKALNRIIKRAVMGEKVDDKASVMTPTTKKVSGMLDYITNIWKGKNDKIAVLAEPLDEEIPMTRTERKQMDDAIKRQELAEEDGIRLSMIDSVLSSYKSVSKSIDALKKKRQEETNNTQKKAYTKQISNLKGALKRYSEKLKSLGYLGDETQ